MDTPSSSTWSAIALLATLSTASWLQKSIQERRAGRDPAALEPVEEARAFLERTLPELGNLFYQLLTHAIYKEEAAITPEVHAFERMMHILRVRRLLHRVHQRLLSLYPIVSEGVIESVRKLELEAEHLIEGDSQEEMGYISLAEQGLQLLRELQKQLV